MENPIVLENRKPGTERWRLEAAGLVAADDLHAQIKGYASATSVNRGGEISLFVSVNPAQSYTVEVHRVGWYGGAGGRLVARVGPLAGVPQPACPVDPATGLIACVWSVATTLAIGDDWTSGIYLAVLADEQGVGGYVPFVVRDDARPAALLYQQSVTTYQAYNRYPDDGVTGKSLYGDSHGPPTIAGNPRAVRVSFDRPYANDGAGQFLLWEVHFVRWLERSGYDVTYTTGLDTHEHGERLLAARGFLSVGHDEYWSLDMRRAVERARDAGAGLAFFGANEAYWQVRFEPSAAGVPDRVMVCTKDAALDPGQGERTTVRFRDPPVNLPEQTLVGIQHGDGDIIAGGIDGVYAPYVVGRTASWVFAESGLAAGDAVPGIVGYEADHFHPDVPLPPARDDGPWTLLADSPFPSIAGDERRAHSSIYRAPSGAWVFAAGTIGWSYALDDLGGRGAPDDRLERVTANVLDRLGAP